MSRLLRTSAPRAVILIRLLVGCVFLAEGIQKFLFPEALGVGRFVKIGIPWPQIMAPFVGICEIGCGMLLLLGLLTPTSGEGWLLGKPLGDLGARRHIGYLPELFRYQVS